MIYFFITLGLFSIAVLVMSVGYIFQNKCLRGSCGGEGAVGPDGEVMNCQTCPNRKK